MNETISGSGPDDGAAGTWTSETLPMDVRKQLLERELRKLGFRKAGPGGHDGAAQGAAPAGASSHPQADAPADGHGG
jgi:hypothetical protein